MILTNPKLTSPYKDDAYSDHPSLSFTTQQMKKDKRIKFQGTSRLSQSFHELQQNNDLVDYKLLNNITSLAKLRRTAN